VAFGLGSSCPSRRWFPERTADVARALWERHRAAAVLVGTGADRTFADTVRAALAVPVRDLVGQTSLRELLAVVAETSLTVTPDSGTMHLSAALGVPVVSLWGATSPARSAPFGSETLVVPGWARCAPCYLEECRIGRVCMQAINAEAVIDRASDVLRSLARPAGP
jgi:ADP-heptose:LPS heptosyltransferase